MSHNYCLDSAASVSASSSSGAGFPASSVIDGARGALSGQYWRSAEGEGPHSLTVNFGRANAPASVAAVVVATLADDFPLEPNPDEETRAGDMGVEDFDVLLLDAAGGVVASKSVVGNDKAVRRVVFEDRPRAYAVRVVVTKARENAAALTEVEALAP